MKRFEISAEFKMGKYPSKTKKIIEAESETHARDKIMRILGTKHGTPRRFINILSIAESSDVSVVLDNPNDNGKDKK